jgi:transcriptional regulator with XRE-family HTH domain
MRCPATETQDETPLGVPSGDSLATRLRAARRSAGLSQGNLALQAGVSTYTVFQIEAGGHPHPRTATLERLAQVLGVSRAWLRTGQEPSGEP